MEPFTKNSLLHKTFKGIPMHIIFIINMLYVIININGT